MIWHDLLKLINDHNRFVISSHLSLDGDSVGSQLAFYWYLNSLGKEVILFDIDPVPAKFVFLKNTEVHMAKQHRFVDCLLWSLILFALYHMCRFGKQNGHF